MSETKPPQPEFDQFAGQYEQMISEPAREWFAGVDFFHKRKMDVLLDLLARRKRRPESLKWLDFGCGKGDLLRLGRDRFGLSVGCDVSAEMTSACQDIEVRVQSDPAKIPFPDASMDLVTAVCVYHHVPVEERAALTLEITRVLKPGGWFAIIEHNPYNPITQLVVRRCPVDENAILLNAAESAARQRAAGLSPMAPLYFLYVPAAFFGMIGGLERLLGRLPLGGQYFQIGVKPGDAPAN